ncbi:hypothetical protein EVAR_66739_1 [Eumeta japonica]|uniref:Uncharacterized protein n=1 Tax=Eumeta variegata TaxID=151549 RepID=A0A4C1SFY8_EUMVA|nr:hypothetical protein EVAR_66739_1 [Eumeta japonica]
MARPSKIVVKVKCAHSDLLPEEKISFSALCAAVNHRLKMPIGSTTTKLLQMRHKPNAWADRGSLLFRALARTLGSGETRQSHAFSCVQPAFIDL